MNVTDFDANDGDDTVVSVRSRTRLPTAFTVALREVVARVPGARGAVFLDFEGEAVDEFADVPTMEIHLVGAHLGIILALIREQTPRLGAPEEVIIEAERATLLIRAIDSRYLVVLDAEPEAQIGRMSRELRRAVEALRAQM
jgi:predicted regulator of Ras-like GTPase activity (Roadblock/LC7/MglB family)